VKNPAPCGKTTLRTRRDDQDGVAGDLCAPARPEEVTSLRAFLRQTTELGSKKAAASEMVRVLFNTNEFLYVD
jgi:hypothetical protein